MPPRKVLRVPRGLGFAPVELPLAGIDEAGVRKNHVNVRCLAVKG